MLLKALLGEELNTEEGRKEPVLKATVLSLAALMLAVALYSTLGPLVRPLAAPVLAPAAAGCASAAAALGARARAARALVGGEAHRHARLSTSEGAQLAPAEDNAAERLKAWLAQKRSRRGVR